MEQSILQELESIVGKDRITVDPVETSTYGYDAAGECYAAPGVVVWPIEEREVSAILKLANRESIPVTPRGMGSGRVGASVPSEGGIVISMEKMNRILEIDKINRQVLVEPGVNTATLKETVLKDGLFYPPDPASAKFCTIGGNLATSAGGLSCLKYGTTKDYAQQLRVVLADGSVISVGSRAQKSVTGYNLLNLFVGSEGTLGIITQARLRLLPAPKGRATLLAEFASVDDAATTVTKIVVHPSVPCSLEFADKGTIECARKYTGADLSEGCGAVLLIQVDTVTAGDDVREFAEICGEGGATLIRYSEDPVEQESIWDIRRSFSPATFKAARRKLAEDVSVPASAIPDLLRRVAETAETHDMRILCFGHAGDGNVHVNVLTDLDVDPKMESTLRDIFTAGLDLGGTLSGEHGVGLTKAPFIRMEIGERELNIMRRIKALLDPKGILNPEKIFGPNAPDQ